MKRVSLHIVTEPRPWPFMSSDPRMVEQPERKRSDGCNGCENCTDYSADQDDSPYCRCDNLPTFDEAQWNKCASCGRPLK